jgi:hypothetical protein
MVEAGPGAHTGLGPAASANQMRLKFTSRPADDGKVVASAPVAAAVADGGGCWPPHHNNLRTGATSALGSCATWTRQLPGPLGSTTRVQCFDSPPKDAHNTRKTVGRRLGKPRSPQSGCLMHISTPPMRGAFLVGQEGNRASERTWQGTVMSTRRPVESQARRHAPPQFSLHGKGLGGRGVCCLVPCWTICNMRRGSVVPPAWPERMCIRESPKASLKAAAILDGENRTVSETMPAFQKRGQREGFGRASLGEPASGRFSSSQLCHVA